MPKSKHQVPGRVRATDEFIKANRDRWSVQALCRAPRVFLDLREAGETCRKHRVARLIGQANLRALQGCRVRRWAAGEPSVLIPNLLQRPFTVTRRNKAWVIDITYVRTWQGWLYLASSSICVRA